MKANVFIPPTPVRYKADRITTFLAGSIEMDTADRWQDRVIVELQDFDIDICNPRRSNWDNTIEQSIKDPRFVEQVEWELRSLENSDLVLIYFDPDTEAPISLLELGLFSKDTEMIVCCPPGFWRKGNVDVVCHRYGVEVVETFEDFIQLAKHKLVQMSKIV